MNRPWYRWHKDTLLLNIHLQPGAKINHVNGLINQRLRIKIKSPPVDGKANKELISMLARDFGTKKSRVRISSGELGRDKLVEVHSPETLPAWFRELNGKETLP